VLAAADDVQQAERVLSMFSRQDHEARRCVIISNDCDVHRLDGAIEGSVRVLDWNRASEIVPKLGWISIWSANDSYGRHYLSGLAAAVSYTNAAVIGKAAWCRNVNGAVHMADVDLCYRDVESIAWKRSIVRADSLAQSRTLSCLAKNVEDDVPALGRITAADPWGYCEGGQGQSLPESIDIA
jgi:hypothetical protein